jgi:hypothetical protein
MRMACLVPEDRFQSRALKYTVSAKIGNKLAFAARKSRSNPSMVIRAKLFGLRKSPTRLLTMLLGFSEIVPIDDGNFVLGQFVDLDGPRRRTIGAQIVGF